MSNDSEHLVASRAEKPGGGRVGGARNGKKAPERVRKRKPWYRATGLPKGRLKRKPRPYKHGLLTTINKLDGRTKLVKAVKDYQRRVIDQLGGPENVTFGQERLACLASEIEVQLASALRAAYEAGSPFNSKGEWLPQVGERWDSKARLLLSIWSQLGLKPVAKNLDDLQTILAEAARDNRDAGETTAESSTRAPADEQETSEKENTR